MQLVVRGFTAATVACLCTFEAFGSESGSGFGSGVSAVGRHSVASSVLRVAIKLSGPGNTNLVFDLCRSYSSIHSTSDPTLFSELKDTVASPSPNVLELTS